MSEPMAGFTEVKAKCVVCGEEKAVSACWNVTGGWLCAACDSVGRVWAARMARNPELVFDVPVSAAYNTFGYVIGMASNVSPLPSADTPVTVEANRG